MDERLTLLAEGTPSEALLVECRLWRQGLAEALGTPVDLALVERTAGGPPATGAVGPALRERFAPTARPSAAPMGAAPFVWRPDGRPDWGAMWSSFCELALHGGPPHRGEDAPLRAPAAASAVEPTAPSVAEIRRGIWETTGLFAEPAGPGWIAVTGDSAKMAAWLCATIILENVEARCDEERLLGPADPSFRLTDEVKSVITVVAKTAHYWRARVRAADTAAG
jgi:sirohydrochlorin cobaltochelatase